MSIHKSLTGLQGALSAFSDDKTLVSRTEMAGQELVRSLQKGGKILIAGNGGSAAEAQHFSAELVGRFKEEREALPAIALTVDTSILTAVGNDYSFEDIFSRQVEALGQEGDVLVLLSTSGNSKNLLLAADAAIRKKINVVSLLGKDGGALKDKPGTSIIMPSQDTARIQELHLLIIHAWCSLIDSAYVDA